MTENEAFEKIKNEVARIDRSQIGGFVFLEGGVQAIISVLRDLMQNPDYQERKNKYLDTILMLDSRLRNEITDASDARRASAKKNAALKRQGEYQNAVAKAINAVKRDLDYIIHPKSNM